MRCSVNWAWRRRKLRHCGRPGQSDVAATEILLLGDLILDVPEPDHWLAGIAPITRAADLAIGHLEVPYTNSEEEMPGDVPAPGADPAHLGALARAGIGAVSMAGNHMMDCGVPGLAETLAGLDHAGIARAGAGMTLAAARAPARMTKGGRRIALLSYNCVGPELCWATADKPGCAYVHVRTDDGSPSRPQATLREIDAASLAAMAEDIAAARRDAELVVVALHKGITHQPAVLADYERPLATAAIRAGADVVAGHHAHIARGIELVDGKPVFHGLGNGCVVTHALAPAQEHPARAEWAERRQRMFGFTPLPDYPLAPFHPEARNGLIGRLLWHDDGRLEAGFVPLWFEPPGRPVPAGARAEAVARYIERIGCDAGLPPLVLRRDGAAFMLG
ncbi:MAG: CapA family protein [Sphingomonadales bacterium]|nr:CapA family protein [Sphingomonadales bacterium]